MFAFARDDGLPFSKWLGTVSVPSLHSISMAVAEHVNR